MSLFRKFFGVLGDEEENDKKQDIKSPYTPDITLPIDEQFTFNFKANGGKFIYCENLREISENFENILAENDWFECNAQCFDNRLLYLLNENKLTYNNDTNPVFFLSSCENLIADEGSILFSSNQLKHFKPNELPVNMVVFATTSQIVNSKSDGLRKIKSTHEKNYPSNITTIKYFEEVKEQDFLHYGSCHKNLYLLLLEDL
ncbi:lactate utilization protein [Flavobacterium sp. HXWNR69]|uniref:Lactate utilization protein n=1 Tax=Flavobacterium fragile TaxID=2949085 RepID=A0ABT0TE90_9FLAO|nr:lactate utilization protein [Flavobacterium sp. HXWNR69]MCL9769264.1 lactate utilization protein [Flavobacterium sp. HXWNR69]